MPSVTARTIAPFILAISTGSAFAQPPPEYADGQADSSTHFARIATFPVYLNQDQPQTTTVAEIVAAGKNGQRLVYTDGENGELGFVNLSDPAKPQPAGTVSIGGEPTSVAVSGGHVLAVTNTSESYTAPSGELVVLDIESKRVLARHALGGQPDSIAVSPDGRYAAIVIENERDEDLGDGRPSQMPAGDLVIVELQVDPADWQLRRVNLTGISDRFPNDPEPEFVDINADNIAAVTLQENNYIVLVDLASGEVINDFSAGKVDLKAIDAVTDGVIIADDDRQDVPREPDGISWISDHVFATADEGDLSGGSRGFTLFTQQGEVIHTSGNALEHTAIRLGHFPEDRASKKGVEPENVEYARYGDTRMLFVGAERASLIYVYQLDENDNPHFVQALPSGVKPEGLLALPERGLFVAASEEDDIEGGIRSSLTIYAMADSTTYPAIVSGPGPTGVPIAWGALSALAVDAEDPNTAYTVHDSFYGRASIYRLALSNAPAVITHEIILHDEDGVLADTAPGLVSADGTVNLDAEGIDLGVDDGFWIASEGRGSVDNSEKPLESPNLLLRVSAEGVIEEAVSLPDAVNDQQRRHGFEGIAVIDGQQGESIYVAFQREWVSDPKDHVRIGRYRPATGEWSFAYYPLEQPASPASGWVGLSDLANLGNGSLAVLERDNHSGGAATIKHLYRFSTETTDFRSASEIPELAVIEKKPVRDLIPTLLATGGEVLEKLEGLAVANGDALILTDNDGVDGSNGETRLIRLKAVFTD